MTTAPTNVIHEGFFTRLVNRLTDRFEQHAQATSRRAAIEALEAKSDRELAEMGLRRDEIAHYVFRDLFYA
ncbi:MAG: hypothetical protein AAFW87_04990 [Pseudomonadota bacterium]